MYLNCETQICFHCNNTFTSKKRLAMHETHVHGPKLSCKIRAFKSARKDKLMKHKERVHENKRFECETCDSVLSSKMFLSKHIWNTHGNTFKFGQ